MERLYWDTINFNNEKMFFTVTKDGLNFISNPGQGISQIYNFYKKQSFEFKYSKKITISYRKQLEAYLNGSRKSFYFPIDLSGIENNMMNKGLKTIQQINYGEIISLDQLAEQLHINDNATLFKIIKSNPILIVIPTHRIIMDEKYADYFRESLTMKNQLLELETISNMD